MAVKLLTHPVNRIKERFGGQVYPLAEYYCQRLPVAPALAAFQSIRKRAEEWVISRGSSRR